MIGKPAVYRWRSHGHAEVDLILERDNWYYPIEIKCKSQISRKDISGIKAFKETYPQLNIGPALVICACKQIESIGSNCYAIPFDLCIPHRLE